MTQTDSWQGRLPKLYDPHQVEAKWYAFWEQKGYFHADTASQKPRYCITIPPPNVTGSLHMGHALQHALHDLLARWKRMSGFETLILPGTDHAGIPTQMKVEAELAQEGKTRRDLGRDRFIERMWAWKEKYGGQILHQFRALGCSYDWRRERFTLDEGYYRAVLTAFVHFYDRGWIYRGYRVVNWCPACRTTVSDLEIEHVEHQGHLWYVKYPLVSGQGEIIVATTRPETMLGDQAVAVHPDSQWASLVGQEVYLPATEYTLREDLRQKQPGRRLPVIEDDAVDPEFGTGALKITPCHDPLDYEIAQRHRELGDAAPGDDQVAPLQDPETEFSPYRWGFVIGKDGRMTRAAGPHAGKDGLQAREEIVRYLEERGLLAKVEDYVHSVGHHDKCGTMIEPLLSEQWFVNMAELGKRARDCLERDEIAYLPDRFRRYALEWLDDLRDWNISRQIWWGHRIPVWTCKQCGPGPGRWIVRVDPPQKCPNCGGVELEQDPDVLDTWFSSALWPFAVLGWPDDADHLEQFYPTQLLITGRDILYLWVVRMVMTSLELRQQIPFEAVFVHPTILDPQGRRMSKSLGTGVDPMDLIGRYGADAVRFGLVVQCASGQDIRFTAERIEAGRNFCNKIWNAARFVLMSLDGVGEERVALDGPSLEALVRGAPAPDRWIASRLSATARDVTTAFENYRFDEATRLLYDFFWGEFCDWYLEMAKPTLRQGGEAAQRTRRLLVGVLANFLKLLHPIMPFITEEIWQALPVEGESIMTAPWPGDLTFQDSDSEQEVQLVRDVVRAARDRKVSYALAPSDKVELQIFTASDDALKVLREHEAAILFLSGASSMESTGAAEYAPGARQSPVPVWWQGQKTIVDIASALSDDERAARAKQLDRQLAQHAEKLAQVQAKLANPNFREKAPPQVVAKARKDREQLEEKIAVLQGYVGVLRAKPSDE